MKHKIFFSHTTTDSVPLDYLKNVLISKTNNTIEVFLSSDGQSIPFGSNWITKIEQALDNSVIMFVFVTPNSLKSNWIYFESGYSYGKKVTVIPIGLNVDIAEVKPPLNQLQGFNITTLESLNNIIKVFNDHFKSTYPDFTEEEYSEFMVLLNQNSSIFNISDYLSSIFSRIEFTDEIDGLMTSCKDTIIQNAQQHLLKTEKIYIVPNLPAPHQPFDNNNFKISGNGIRFYFWRDLPLNRGSIQINFSLLNFKLTFEAFKEYLFKNELFTEINCPIDFTLNSAYQFMYKDEDVSACINDLESIKIETDQFSFKTVNFTLPLESTFCSSPKLIIQKDTKIEEIYELFQILVENGVIVSVE